MEVVTKNTEGRCRPPPDRVIPKGSRCQAARGAPSRAPLELPVLAAILGHWALAQWPGRASDPWSCSSAKR
jgi:hypothetical protein